MEKNDIYLRPLSGGDVRVTTEPTTEYSYLPLRASGFYGDFVNTEKRIKGKHISINEVLSNGNATVETIESNIELLKQQLSLLSNKINSEK